VKGSQEQVNSNERAKAEETHAFGLGNRSDYFGSFYVGLFSLDLSAH